MLPWASNDGGDHSPPPELTPGLPHRPWTWSHGRSGVPVCAYSAHKSPLTAPAVLSPERVDRHGGHVHSAVVVARGHVDALMVVAGQRPAPQLHPGRGV